MWHIKINKKPLCTHCGKPVDNIDPFMEYHEHISCRTELIANRMITKMKKDVSRNNTKE